MLLGKRPRPPMKRTTSMSEITFDSNTVSISPLNSHPHYILLFLSLNLCLSFSLYKWLVSAASFWVLMASFLLASTGAQSPASSPAKSLALSPKQVSAASSPSSTAPSTSHSSSPVADSPPSPLSSSPATVPSSGFGSPFEAPVPAKGTVLNRFSTAGALAVEVLRCSQVRPSHSNGTRSGQPMHPLFYL
ncbi:hypothetical protein ACFXTO_041389 [Malus domestica]